MNGKVTLLERYWKLRLDFEAVCKSTLPTVVQLWSYQELVYRIGILEILQTFVKSAPVTDDLHALFAHYQIMDGFIEHLKRERFSLSKNADRKTQQLTAVDSLMSVITDYRKRYNTYCPKTPDQYRSDIGRTIAAVLPAWVSYRDTMTEIKINIEEAAS